MLLRTYSVSWDNSLDHLTCAGVIICARILNRRDIVGTRHWPEDADEYVEELEQQLAKANERVEELEAQQQLLINEIEPLLDLQEDGEYYERTHMAEKIYSDFVEQSLDGALNKFAIEQKVIGYYDSCIESGMNGGQASLLADIYAEQLRKEQQHD